MDWRSMTHRLTRSATLVFAAAVLLCVARAQDQPSPSESLPLLKIDLHKFKYDTSGSTRRLQKFIDFTDADHLAVAWVTLDDPTLAVKPGIIAKPAHLHVLILDTKTGRNAGMQAWPTPSNRVRFFGARDGEFLTCTGNVLRIFSPDFEVIRERDLHSACQNAVASNIRFGASPSKRTLLLSSFAKEGYEYMLLNVETFAVIASWHEKSRIVDISDHWLLGSCAERREACIKRIDADWRPFSYPESGQANDFAVPRFINDDTLIGGWPGKSVVTVEGVPMFQMQPPKNRLFESDVTVSGGDRFAVIEDRNRGFSNPALDMEFFSSERAIVYSVAERRAIYAAGVKGDSLWTPWASHRNQLALSPDGALLAILDGADLKVYRLPDDNSAH